MSRETVVTKRRISAEGFQQPADMRGFEACHEDTSRSDWLRGDVAEGKVENGKNTEYRATLDVTFILHEAPWMARL
jgi:flavin-binding protein dodecin